ncbi:MAG: tRNA pseudouridine(38-40) synthase TruA [Planctomycetota bacterium]
MRLRLTLAYRGTHFHGWQEQVEGLRTVQREVRHALQQVVRHPVTVVGSSRTDAGVHAKGQVARFDTHMTQIPLEGMRKALNAKLPVDVLAVRIDHAADDFDTIGDTIDKRYQYQIWTGDDRNLFLHDLAFHRRGVSDLAAMRAAAGNLVGTHDFASFAKPGHGREHTVRTITDCTVSRRGQRIVIGVEGTGFLWNQVRIIAGTLAEVGRGKIDPDSIPDVLAAQDRTAAGPTAPAHGLFLQWIRHRTTSAKPATESADATGG